MLSAMRCSSSRIALSSAHASGPSQDSGTVVGTGSASAAGAACSAAAASSVTVARTVRRWRMVFLSGRREGVIAPEEDGAEQVVAVQELRGRTLEPDLPLLHEVGAVGERERDVHGLLD